MLGGMGAEEVIVVRSDAVVANKEHTAKIAAAALVESEDEEEEEEVAKPKFEQEEEEAAEEGDDEDYDPLGMLGGMGAEEVIVVRSDAVVANKEHIAKNAAVVVESGDEEE